MNHIVYFSLPYTFVHKIPYTYSGFISKNTTKRKKLVDNLFVFTLALVIQFVSAPSNGLYKQGKKLRYCLAKTGSWFRIIHQGNQIN